MHTLLALLLAAFAPPVTPPPTPQTTAPAATVPDAGALMAGVQAFYQQTTDFKARFAQTYVNKAFARTQTSGGRVFFKKPGRMRWDYDPPNPKLLISDGTTLWVYEPQESQAFKRALKTSQLPVALTFMSGQGKLEDEFTGAALPPPDATSWLLALTPKHGTGDYQSVQLQVDRKTFAVTASTVVDPVGNTNTIVFSSFETNKGLPDKGFEFTPPAGVKVLEGNGGGFAP